MINEQIGKILVDMGALTAEQLSAHLGQAEQAGKMLGQYLRDEGIITPVDLAKAYAQYASLPYIDVITDEMASPDLLAKVPIKFLRENHVIPVYRAEHIVIITANPLRFAPTDELNMLLGGECTLAVAPAPTIADAINRYYPLEGTREVIEELAEQKGVESVSFEEIEEKDILTMASEAPIIKLVNHILFQAVKRDASDIHIEPFEKEVRVRDRVDGVMYTMLNPPKRIQSALVSRIKVMAHCDIAKKQVPQGGRIQIKVADRQIDIRVSILPVAFGERVVMRLLDKGKTFATLDKLGLSERDYRLLEESIHVPNGIVYVTGPTGSGKTSTLYAVLAELNTPEVNIITVEDPVEYQMAGVSQVQVHEKVGLNFAAALREILRQDPDVIMIGETRDQETAQIAVQSALTGHLVLSTLHTNSAPAAITRLLDMGIEPYLIASSVVAVVAQRLVRRLCNACKKPYKPTAEMLRRIGINEAEAASITFFGAQGCHECSQSGYKGRLAVFELMRMTDRVAALTMERSDTSLLTKQAMGDGMTTLLQDGVRKIKAGVTTIEEVLSAAASESEFA